MAENPAFTPGPWQTQDSIVLDGRGLTVAHCLICSGGNGFIVPAECLANARLIAAAPQMYEAGQEIADATAHLLEMLEGDSEPQWRTDAMNALLAASRKMRAALKLARGEG